jgi:UDP-GlcNAc:undecaprenyl-phosphate GlcNAc-1-phosphate transferase
VTIVFLLGLCDDIFSVSARWKFGVQGIAAALLYAEGYRVNYFYLLAGNSPLYPVISFALTILWVLWITNAFNLIDGMDGLAAGSALFSTAVVFIVSVALGNAVCALVTAALAGAILGFLRFNFNPATVFLGDCGSLFIGFVLSAVALAGSQKAPTLLAVAIPVLAFGLPLLDVVLAVARRFLRGRPLFEPDADHIHHRLLKRGLSHRASVLILYGVSASFALLSLLLLSPFGYKWGVVAVVGATGAFIGLHELRYQEFAEIQHLFLRLFRQRQTIGNNLRLIHAVETIASCESISQICMAITQALEPVGFDAILLKCDELSRYDSSMLIPMVRNRDGELVYSWTDADPTACPWRLSLRLVASNGMDYGTLSIVRESYEQPILLDGHVFGASKLTTALADALERCEKAMYGPRSRHEETTIRSAGSPRMVMILRTGLPTDAD